MSKRQEIRERQRQKQSRQRLWVILAVSAGALLIAFFLIWPNIQPPQTSDIVQITPLAAEVPVNKTSMGNADAPVKVDVWEDFQCSGCVSYTENLEPQLIETFVKTGKVYYTFHFYPFIDGGQGESHDAANAAMCAAEQGRFWDYHAMIYANWKGENVGSFTAARLKGFAEVLGLDMGGFNLCYQQNTYETEILSDAALGAKQGVPPTPGIFVNGQLVVSSAGANYLPSFDDIAKAIEGAQ